VPLLLLACVHALPVAVEEPPPPVGRAAIRWFDLEGADRVDLLESCVRNCPRDDAGTIVTSLTTWEILWTWERRPWEPCEVASVLVDPVVTVLLPRWDAPPDADPALVDEWSTYVDRLRFHEQGHVDLVYEYAGEAAQRIGSAGCDGAGDAAAALFDEVRRAQADYDATTQNGHTQGASFWEG
jgi:predicted secreted Zn-dependent protease